MNPQTPNSDSHRIALGTAAIGRPQYINLCLYESPKPSIRAIPPFPIEEEGDHVFRIVVGGKTIGERTLKISLVQSGTR